MKRRLLILITMLTVLIALSLSATAQDEGEKACKACGLQCANEAWFLMAECWSNGGSTSQCQNTYNQYVNNCKSIFCNSGLGCDFPINY